MIFKDALSGLRDRPVITYLVIFFVLMTASLLMVPAVRSGSQAAPAVLILLVILTNLLSLVY